MTIGILCAIPEELNHLREAIGDVTSVQIAHSRFDLGALDGYEVVLAEAGIGKVHTGISATLLAHHFGARLIVFSGVAGGLDPDLAIGDVVIANRTIQHDAGMITGERIVTYQAGHVPFFNPTDRLGYPVDPDLLARVKERLQGFSLPPLPEAAGGKGQLPRIAFGPILTGDQYLHCEITRERLFQSLGGQAIEMEGAALGQVAERFDIPYLDIRALSDLAGHEAHFDFAAFAHAAAAGSAAILRHILPVL